MSKIAIVYHFGYGHTEKQAEAVRDGAADVENTKVDFISVDDVDDNWERLAAADAIIFGSPTHMGSVSAPFKEFMDKSSKVWAEQGWKDKIAAGFTNSASQSGDKLATLQQMAVLGAQHSMIWVGLGLLPGNNSSTGSVDDLNELAPNSGQWPSQMPMKGRTRDRLLRILRRQSFWAGEWQKFLAGLRAGQSQSLQPVGSGLPVAISSFLPTLLSGKCG